MSLINTYIYDTDSGASDGTAVASGSNGVVAKAGTVNYSSAGAVHGSLGIAVSAATGGIGYTLPATSGQVSGYIKTITDPGSSNSTLMGIRNSAGSYIHTRIRVNHVSGKFEMLDPSSTVVATSTASYSTSTPIRIDIRFVYDSTGNTITATTRLYIGSNVEGTTPDETMSPAAYSVTAATAPGRAYFGANTGSPAWSFTADTLRLYDDVVTWPAPFQAAATASGSLSFSGSASSGPVAATATGSVSLSGVPVAQAPVTATGSINTSGSVAAKGAATATGSLSFGGSATGVGVASGIAGSIAYSATSDAHGPGSVAASGAGSMSLSATAAASGTGFPTPSIAFSSTANAGSRATVSGNLAFSTTGNSSAQVTAAGSVAFSGSATYTPPAGTTATGSMTLSATAATAASVPSNIYIYEEGTDGAAILSGANGVIAKAGTVNYSAAAATHGLLGAALSGSGGALGYALAVSQGQISAYFKSITDPGSSNSALMGIRNSAGTIQTVRLRTNHVTGKFDLFDSSSVVQATSTTSYSTVTNGRVDIRYSWDGVSVLTVTARMFYNSNSEGTTPDETLGPVSISSTNAPGRVYWGPTSAGWGFSADTLRLYSDTASWPTPYTAVQAANGSLSLGATATILNTGQSAGSLSLVGSVPGAQAINASGSLSLANSVSVASVVHHWTGDPLSDGFVLTSKTAGAYSVRLAVSTSLSMTSPTYFGPVTPDSSGYVHITATGLSPNTKYFYQLGNTPSGGGFESLFGPVGIANTIQAAGSPAAMIKIGFGSCQQNNSSVSASWDNMIAWGPQFAVHVGDLHYQSSQSVTASVHAGLLATQIQNAAGLKTAMSSFPIVYVNSDHEAGPDNGDSDNLYTAAFNTAYKQVVPARMVDTGATPVGKYRTWVIGRVRFILIDVRNTDRSPGANADDVTKTMLGATQKAWLKTQLLQPEPLKVILCDVPWMGPASLTNGGDKWWAYSTERQEIANFIVSNGVNVDFWHGDSHRVAVDRTHNGSTGGFPVICGSPFDNKSGGSETDGTWDAYYEIFPNFISCYQRMTITDNGATITRTASGWDSLVDVERTNQVFTWSTPGNITGGMSFGGGSTPSGRANATGSLSFGSSAHTPVAGTAVGFVTFSGTGTGLPPVPANPVPATMSLSATASAFDTAKRAIGSMTLASSSAAKARIAVAAGHLTFASTGTASSRSAITCAMHLTIASSSSAKGGPAVVTGSLLLDPVIHVSAGATNIHGAVVLRGSACHVMGMYPYSVRTLGNKSFTFVSGSSPGLGSVRSTPFFTKNIANSS